MIEIKKILTEEERDLYDKIVLLGDIFTMFEFGYHVGRERATKETLEIVKQTLIEQKV